MTLGTLLAGFYTLGWIPLFVIRPESMRDSLPQYGWGERVAAVVSPVVMSVHVALSCITVARTGSIPAWSAALSALVFAAGIGFWVWARRMIGPLFVQRVPQERPLRLQRHGAFGIVRNPLYLGALVAAGAPLLAVARPLLGVTYALCSIALAIRSLQDEARLREQLGAVYEDYSRQVKRHLWPMIW